MTFSISTAFDADRVFLLNHNGLEGRLDSHFYRPSLVATDSAVRAKAKSKLGDFIVSMSGGATPKKADRGKYYSDKDHGIPFLRVQNITEEGISLEEVIYINHNTHNGYLRRSRVYPNDLLVTITGRIASSAVAPPKFVANINQHSVVIKTENKEISKYLATFLNSNVGQKLALKRTTGGTRPALDYDALRNMPIVEGLPIVDVMTVAYTAKAEKENEAQILLDGIDGYLLDELEIQPSQKYGDDVAQRIFRRQLSEMSGGRLDPFYSSLSDKSMRGKYKHYELKHIATVKKGDSITSNSIADGDVPVIAGGQSSPYYHGISNYGGDVITVSASGAYAGYVWYHDRPIYASDCTVIYSTDTGRLLNRYLFEYLKLEQQNIYNLQHGSGQPHVYPVDLCMLQIPVPPLEKQAQIVKHIKAIRIRAKQLRSQAETELTQAKKNVESRILA